MVVAVEGDSVGLLLFHKISIQRQIFRRHGFAVRPFVFCIACKIIVGHNYRRVPAFQMVARRAVDIRLRREDDLRSSVKRPRLCIVCHRGSFQCSRINVIRQRCSGLSRSIFFPHCIQRNFAIYHEGGEVGIVAFVVKRTSSVCIQLPANEAITRSHIAATRDVRHLIGIPFYSRHCASRIGSIFIELHCIFGIVLSPLGIEPLRSITTWPRVANIERI